MWEKTGGLLFLFPHIKKFAIDGEDSLIEVFPLDKCERKGRSRWPVLDLEYRAHSQELSTEYIESGQADERHISSYRKIWVKAFMRSFCAFGV